MEFSKKQIASLVLGYLRSEKCSSTFKKFLEESGYFKENIEIIKKGKYFPVTRVAGLCLEDFLKEYSDIYSIVEGRIEVSNYYEENDARSGSLVQKLLYLLSHLKATTPDSCISEVETTPVHALPGNKDNEETSLSKIKRKHLKQQKKKTSTSEESTSYNSNEEAESLDVSEVISNTLLENRELHERLAETINSALSTSLTEGTKDKKEGIGKELENLVKSVVEKTEEDPIFNDILENIFPSNKVSETQTETSDNYEDHQVDGKSTTTKKDQNTENQNTIVVPTSIIIPSQSQPVKTVSTVSNDIYLFDGTLDSYLKTSNTSTMSQNSFYLDGNLLVMSSLPPATINPINTPKSIYLLNNQPLITMPKITENDIMTMPTVIINEEPLINNKVDPKTNSNDQQLIVNNIQNQDKVIKESELNTPLDGANAIQQETSPKSSSSTHVRSLDFSTPLSSDLIKPFEENKIKTSTPLFQDNLKCDDGNENKKNGKSEKKNSNETSLWDANLRKMACVMVEKFPLSEIKYQKAKNETKKKTQKKDFNSKTTKEIENNEKTELKDDKEKDKETKETPTDVTPEKQDKENAMYHQTPLKSDEHPKTPGLPMQFNILTPFSNAIEEQLRDIDLSSLSTPRLPITPGFSLTPSDNLLGPYTNRSTDYSTCSSYYHPSDTEQNKSLEQLLNETKTKPTTKNEVKILSQVVVEPIGLEGKTTSNCKDTLKKFQSNIIGRKNLNLVQKDVKCSSSSEVSSDEEEIDIKSNYMDNESNNTVIHKPEEVKENIKEIETISKTIPPAKDNSLEEIKKRTIKILNEQSNEKQPRKRRRLFGKSRSKLKFSPRKRKLPTKTNKNIDHEEVVDEESDEEKTERPPPKKSENSKLKRTRGSTKKEEIVDKKKPKRAKSKTRKESEFVNNKDKNKEQSKENTEKKEQNPKSKTRKESEFVNNIDKNKEQSEENKEKKEQDPKSKTRKESEFVNNIDKNKEQSEENKEKKEQDPKSKTRKESEFVNENKEQSEENTEKEEPDPEAEKLLKGLKQMGIYLVPNKSPSKQTPTKQLDKITEKKPPPKILNRKVFNFKEFVDEIHIVYDKNNCSSKSLSNYEPEILKKEMNADVWMEQESKEIIRTVAWTPFESLLDIKSEIVNVLIPRKVSEIRKQEESGEKGETENILQSTPVRKRKLSKEESPKSNKKINAYLNNANIDTLLDKLHGGI